MTIEELVKKYNYKKLPTDLSKYQRQQYLSELPYWCNIKGDLNCSLFHRGILISFGYKRIVIGDYGAYIEIPPKFMAVENIKIKPGQEYRFEEKYKNIKYHWYCLKYDEEVKIYYQKNTVSYADYIPEMCYISPYDVDEIRKI